MTHPLICSVCNAEGEVPIFTFEGHQTEYTARCPHCLGVGLALPIETSPRAGGVHEPRGAGRSR